MPYKCATPPKPGKAAAARFKKIKQQRFEILNLISILFDNRFPSGNIAPLLSRNYYSFTPKLKQL
jgi:hypothetical protein